MRLTKPMLGDLYGYWSGSSTCTFHMPPVKGAVVRVLARGFLADLGLTDSHPDP